MMYKSLAIGSDHAGYELKEKVKSLLGEYSETIKDFGTHSADSVDYPDFAHPLASAVAEGLYPKAVLICGSANGVCMTANKHQDVRAAIAWTPEIASLAVEHNNANVICLPARFISEETAGEIIKAFMTSSFEGGRHERRAGKINC